MCLRIGDASFLKTLVSPTSYIRPDLEHLEFQPPRKMPPPLQEQALFGFGAIRVWGEDGVGWQCWQSYLRILYIRPREDYELFVHKMLITNIGLHCR